MIRLHQLAALTAATTFTLLLLGNVVWGTGSSLACPDWPTCHGSFFPEMRGGVLFEHSHRLLGAAVGVLTIGMAWLASREERRRRLVIASLGAVAIVVLQGVLGGLTVLLRLPALVSIAHLATAMAFFTLLLWISWRARGSGAPSRALSPGARRAVFAAYAATYLQIVLGGVVRHTGSAAACTDFPLCAGQVFPAAAHPSAYVHMSHRLLALVVVACVVFAAVRVLRAPGATRPARVLAWVSVGLVLLQIAVGSFTVLSGLDIAVVTAHLGVGALLLGALLLLGLALSPVRSSEQRAIEYAGERQLA